MGVTVVTESHVTNFVSQVKAAIPKLPFTKKGTVKPMEWVETIDRRGKVCWVERPLKPSQDTQKRPHGTPRPSEKHPAGGAIGGKEFGGSHDHSMGHGAPQKTKVSKFAD